MQTTKFNPEIMVWARTTAGLTLEAAAHALGLNAAYGLTPEQRLTALETGETEPTPTLLSKMAEKYRRPLLVFYLPEPPTTGDRGQDFRTTPGARPPLFDPDLDALIRDIKARQSIVRSLQEDLEAEPVPFIGSVTMSVPAKELAKHIADSMNFSLETFQAQKSTDLAFAYLRARIEDSGVFVLLLGNLGSHHTNIAADVFRGFAIADKLAPFVLINDQDAKIAWGFTALHELVHLWLGTTGLSGENVAAEIEKYCNDVAGEVILPAVQLASLRTLRTLGLRETKAAISAFAESHKVSRAMVTYRLFRSGVIVEQTLRSLTEQFKQDWLEGKAKLQARNKENDGGPNYYIVRRHKLGAALLSLIDNSLRGGFLTQTKAGQVLGVKPRNVTPLLRETPVGF